MKRKLFGLLLLSLACLIVGAPLFAGGHSRIVVHVGRLVRVDTGRAVYVAVPVAPAKRAYPTANCDSPAGAEDCAARFAPAISCDSPLMLLRLRAAEVCDILGAGSGDDDDDDDSSECDSDD